MRTSELWAIPDLELDIACRHDYGSVYECTVCWNVYVSHRGAEACVLTVSGVQTLISPIFYSLSLLVMHHSYKNTAGKQRDRKPFLYNRGQLVFFPGVEDSALNINNLSQVSASHI